jgi:hypothetical protein
MPAKRLPILENPFRPGAGHQPPYLAGRVAENREFRRLLGQSTILENLILTGLRGVGKTVLLDTFKPMAIQEGWRWVGTDLSESTSVSEESLTVRILSDLAVTTSQVIVAREEIADLGFARKSRSLVRFLDYETLLAIREATPGLASDKLKQVLEIAWTCLQREGARGVVFAYDEAQTLSDHAEDRQYPLSLLLEVFQSIQKKGLPMMLVLTGLPTLFPKLVEARTFAERMFRVLFLDRLGPKDSRDAIQKPIEDAHCPVKFSEAAVEQVIELSGGYPFFIQFICRELFDAYIQQTGRGVSPAVPVNAVLHKLDSDFFAGRWARATDRQRELLEVVARLEDPDGEFTVQEIVERSRELLTKGFSPSHASQMLSSLGANGLVYKNRHGKYSLAVPLLGQFIRRQIAQRENKKPPR